jgi:SAM-dependent methyltransferase
MHKDFLKYIICLKCNNPELSLFANEEKEGTIKSGIIRCNNCHAEYEIKGSIPRFVQDNNYCASFGLEWKIHYKTQYDFYSQGEFSQDRFFKETNWPSNLSGQLIIEAGCGSGRFTEWALGTNALVISFDLSRAVDVNFKNNGNNQRLLIAQADIFNIPFRKEIADKIFCFGVMQHTPDPKKAIFSLVNLLKKGGELIFDIYARKIHMKYIIRPLIKGMPPEKLYVICKRWVDFAWPLASFLRKISPKIGPKINWQLMIADYSREGVQLSQLKEWAYLDTFDMLSPKYDIPASKKEVRGWLFELKNQGKIRDFLVEDGYNGIEGKVYK